MKRITTAGAKEEAACGNSAIQAAENKGMNDV
jgi:hypothetical protein